MAKRALRRLPTSPLSPDVRKRARAGEWPARALRAAAAFSRIPAAPSGSAKRQPSARLNKSISLASAVRKFYLG